MFLFENHLQAIHVAMSKSPVFQFQNTPPHRNIPEPSFVKMNLKPADLFLDYAKRMSFPPEVILKINYQLIS